MIDAHKSVTIEKGFLPTVEEGVILDANRRVATAAWWVLGTVSAVMLFASAFPGLNDHLFGMRQGVFLACGIAAIAIRPIDANHRLMLLLAPLFAPAVVEIVQAALTELRPG